MPTNDFRPFATGVAADVESQAQYLVDLGVGGSMENGFVTGVANTPQVNKVERQSSVAAYLLGQLIVDTLGVNAADDGDLATLLANLKAALDARNWSTGDVKMTIKTVADAGWIMCNDGTIGSATSGATYANANAEALFKLIWANVSQANAPVSPGRGASAVADWAANKKINLTKMLGRALAVGGAGAGLTARALGDAVGEEAHVLVTNEMPVHKHVLVDPGHVHAVTDPGHGHNVTDPGHKHTAGKIGQPDFPVNTAAGINIGTADTSTNVTGVTVNQSGSGITVNNHDSNVTMNNTGGGLAHNNMQPTTFLNVMIKL